MSGLSWAYISHESSWHKIFCLCFELVYFYMIQPSERDTYTDIEAVYECLQTEYGISQEDLILYGQSVGSGPTLHLAAQLPRLRGVVLHSAILSGIRVLCQVKYTLCCDIYKVSMHLHPHLKLERSTFGWLFFCWVTSICLI